ncbi:MAG: glycosyltransferase [Candidatus Woesearchaeota archaeon]
MIETIVTVIIFINLYIITFYILALLKAQYSSPSIKKYPEVTILIPAYNEEQGIARTIESCLKLEYGAKIHIVIVNDASKDKTEQIVKPYLKHPQVKLLTLKKNQGKAQAMNIALKQITTPLFAVLDADSTISKKSLKNAVKMFSIKREEPIGAVMSKLKPENENANVLERIQVIEYLVVGLMRAISASLRFLHIAPGVLSVYKTDIVKKIGCFDAKNLTEDFELGVRLKKNGYLIEYAHDSLVFTRTPNSLSLIIKQRIRWFRGFFQTHLKHRDIHFNKKHGLFGWFEFPITVTGIFLLLCAISILGYNIVRGISEFVFKLINTPDLIVWFEFRTLSQILLTLNVTLLVPIIILISIVLFIIYTTFTFYNSRFFATHTVKKIVAVVLYILVYNYMYVYIIPRSLYLELQKRKYDWGTKK